MVHFLKYWFPPIAYAGLIFFLSSRQLPQMPVSIPYFDKPVHLVEYAILAMLLYRTFMNSVRVRKSAAALSIVLTILYGFSDELHQFYVPGRQISEWDFLFDTIGAAVDVLIMRRLFTTKTQSTQR
ncbi:MAG: VanZ family protein [Planctomycetes bacterium]|nr:VanZ family protein [Planctomycetota bacterium]